jgi:predicted GIY-YIG superfamily endonuclease
MVFIYVLQLEQRKYYIGKTNNPTFRLENHFGLNGSAWTKKFRPTKVVELIPNCDDYDEDKYTKKYMAKYGIENVRGGSYVQTELSEFHTEALKMEIWAANDRCMQCGREGHFVKDCYAKTDISGNRIEYEESSDDECEEEESFDKECEWCCEYCDRTFTTAFGCGVHEKFCKEKNSRQDTCYRCGREGHYATTCYASKHIKGYYLK